MLKKILIGLGVLLGGFLTYVAVKPAEFRVERSILIHASPDTVFRLVNDFHKWESWSPWAKMDPNAKNTYEGPESGRNASFSWVGNSDVGEGKMTILESVPPRLIRIDLTFLKPMAGSSLVEFTFIAEANQTLVTWAMNGKNNFIGRLMCTFINMEKMIGGEYEKGLAQIKALAEAS